MTAWPTTRHSFLKRLSDPGSHEVWLEFQRVYVPALYRYARSCGLQQSDAADVVQEVMLAIHRNIGDWIPSNRPGGFRSWLTVTTRRMAFRILRDRARSGVNDGFSAELDIPERLESARGAAEQSETRRWAFFEAAAIVEREVAESTWGAFWQTAVHGRPPESIAKELGISVGTVYAAKCRVLARIRRHIESQSRDES
jgi:RNA polymerase sigma-70 factor, ECF subfamily